MHGRFPIWDFKRIGMKHGVKLNLLWSIVWAIILIAAFVGIFWTPAFYIIVGLAGIFTLTFLCEAIRYNRMK